MAMAMAMALAMAMAMALAMAETLTGESKGTPDFRKLPLVRCDQR
jgi:hypothetical protein